jgi:hypothetical protein
MIATLSVHFSSASELERPDYLITNPSVPIEGYRDSFGNIEVTLASVFNDYARSVSH